MTVTNGRGMATHHACYPGFQRRCSPPLLHATHNRGIRQGPEPGLRDRLSAVLARAVELGLDGLEGEVDLVDGGQRLRREGEIALPVHGDGAALARLLVELDVAGLPVERQRLRLGPQVLGLTLVDLALLEQKRPLSSRNFGSEA